MKTPLTLASLLVVALLVAPMGCQPPAKEGAAGDGHDHGAEGHSHAKPKTFAEGVAQIEHMRDEIKEAFEAGKPESAHDALHDVGHTLNALKGLVRKEAIDAGAEVEAAVEKLFEGFEQLDNRLHKIGDAEWSDVAESIDAGLAELQAVLKGAPAEEAAAADTAPAAEDAPAETGAETDHDHDHAAGEDHDHEHDHAEDEPAAANAP